MMTPTTSNSGHISFNQALQRIQKKHNITETEEKEIDILKKAAIKCIAITTDGGFCKKGNFYKDLSSGMGTIRIKYQLSDQKDEKYLILNRYEEDEETSIPLDFRINALYQKIEDAACFFRQAHIESQRLYFKNLFGQLHSHKKAYIAGLRSQFDLPNYGKKVNGLKCNELSLKGKRYIIKRAFEVQANLEADYRDLLPYIKNDCEKSILESHIKYIARDKKLFSSLKSQVLM